MKEDRCNTNVMSKKFVYKKNHLLKTKKISALIYHSNGEVNKEANEIVVDANIKLENHKYKSN